ncbi:transporter [Pantoea sp. JZ2]|uniref:BRO-N domain-containing protein n=1 Tax=Pantoea sp. JZ2 TaxID=2654189 RepID=UPI002B4AA661|nr:BRO family protein [Pantoea sp. JZ2]WRH12315.1 transporter [Pantoea sp. JZ2]
MNTAIKTFDFMSESGELLASVRAVMIGQEPWFVAADVALALEYSQTQAMTKLIDADDKSTQTILSGCNYTNQSVINESGLYAAIMGSRKPQAKRFKRWVTADVLPSIRATGSYSVKPADALPDFDDPIAAAEAWIEAKKAERTAIGYVDRQARYISKLETQLAEGVTPTQFCKQLNGVNTRLVNAFLEDHNWLYDDRPDAKYPRWRVKAYARDQYLTERPGRVEQENGEMRDIFKPLLKHKGAVWLYRRYLKGELPMKKGWDGKFTHDAELAGNDHAA